MVVECKSEDIAIEPEIIEKVISNTRSSSTCYLFFGLVDFGLVLGALLTLPVECEVTNLKDYFIIALSLTCFVSSDFTLETLVFKLPDLYLHEWIVVSKERRKES